MPPSVSILKDKRRAVNEVGCDFGVRESSLGRTTLTAVVAAVIMYKASFHELL